MAPLPQGRPPFRADHVGSLLRPPALRQAFRRHAAKEIGDAEFARPAGRCIRDVVALQEDVGLQVVTDGEFRRGSYWGRFVERTEGFEIKPASFKFRNDAGHEVEFTAPYANAKIKRMQPLALDEYEFLHGVTKVTAKITLPAPSTMHFYRCNDFADKGAYTDVESFFADLAAIFKQEIGELAKAGCRYIQLDEVAVALLCDPGIREQITGAGSDPDTLVDLYIDSINQAVADCPPEVVIGVHMCRGNFKGHYLGAGGYEVGRRALLRQHQGQSLPARIRHAARRRFRAAALRAEDQGRRAGSHQHQDAGAGKSRRLEGRDRGGDAIHRSRSPRHQSAMRLRQHRRRQSAHRSR